MVKKMVMALEAVFFSAMVMYANDSMSMGFQLGEYGSDLSMGGRITSPYIFGGYTAVQLSGDLVYNNSNNWSPYGGFKLGLIGTGGMINGFARMYGTGGAMFLFNEDASNSLVIGGYGLFGFEFFTAINSPVSYFIEAGTNGSSITRLCGFDVRTGLNYYF